MERESKCGAFTNCIESIFRRLGAFQTSQKNLTMLVLWTDAWAPVKTEAHVAPMNREIRVCWHTVCIMHWETQCCWCTLLRRCTCGLENPRTFRYAFEKKILNEILLFQLQIHLFVGRTGTIMILAR